VVSGLIGMLLVQLIFWKSGVKGATDPVSALLSGSFLFGLFFFATEPISASQLNEGRWIYGALIGVLTVIIRTFSGWAEGMMFAILLANMFAPIMDYGLRTLRSKRKTAEAQ
jgi:Na+-transporting NADH:ubiquinone oxidoreductase subunit B